MAETPLTTSVSTSARLPLFAGLSQYDVDFVVPRVDADLPIGVDPFLLFKSRDPFAQSLHRQLVDAFNAGIAAIRNSAEADARYLFDFPEVAELGFGYSLKRGKRGSGVGALTQRLILDSVGHSPGLLRRGIRHIEEMQLFSAGIGPDRVSDIAASVLKRSLIGYTQLQCRLWDLPMQSGVPVSHIYEHSTHEWVDSYEDLPVSPIDGSAVLLVPRRWVRSLPWINYDHFARTELRSYLAARRGAVQREPVHEDSPLTPTEQASRNKEAVVGLTRADVALVDRYVAGQERRAEQASPGMEYIDDDACRQSEVLSRKLAEMQHGREHAHEYQLLVLEVINFLFSPELVGGQTEVRTIDGTERRDIVFTNESELPFWDYVRTAHDGIFLMFEVKNTADLTPAAINQTATYLGDRIGRLGMVVTRVAPSNEIQKKAISVWNDSGEKRKVILILADDDLRDMLELRCKGGSPTKWMQEHYRRFRTAAQ